MSSNKNNNIQENLKILMQRYELPSGSALAKDLMLPPPTINRLLSGHVTDPRLSTCQLIASYFDISLDELTGSEMTETERPSKTAPPTLMIPVIEHFFFNSIEKKIKKPDDWFQWMTTAPKKNKHCFAIKIPNKNYEPLFTEHSILVVSPKTKPRSFDYVIVQLLDQHQLTIRKYITNDIDCYYHPLQPNHKTITHHKKSHLLLGTIIEAHTHF